MTPLFGFDILPVLKTNMQTLYHAQCTVFVFNVSKLCNVYFGMENLINISVFSGYEIVYCLTNATLCLVGNILKPEQYFDALYFKDLKNNKVSLNVLINGLSC